VGTEFCDAGVPIIGDDIKSQVVPRSRTGCWRAVRGAGVVLDRTYQLNVGGNMDFKNMLERDRLESKKVSKTQGRHLATSPRSRREERAHRPATTCSGSTTASGPTYASRDAHSATCR
jgi:hypothetical protein